MVLTEEQLLQRIRDKRKKRQEFQQNDPAGHNYLMYSRGVGILKFGKTTSKNPLQYIRNRYKPKQLWERIIVIPVEHAAVSENCIKDEVKQMGLTPADGREYYFADEAELQELKSFMQDLAEEQ